MVELLIPRTITNTFSGTARPVVPGRPMSATLQVQTVSGSTTVLHVVVQQSVDGLGGWVDLVAFPDVPTATLNLTETVMFVPSQPFIRTVASFSGGGSPSAILAVTAW